MEVLGLFSDIKTAAGAVDALREGDVGEEAITSMTAVPYPDGVLVRARKKTSLHLFAVAGAFGGAVLGFALAAGTAWLYPLYTGDKPIVSLFPVGIITYEFTMLLAIVGAVVGMFWDMGLPSFLNRAYDPEISAGKIGICVTCATPEDRDRARRILNEAGAERLRIAGKKT